MAEPVLPPEFIERVRRELPLAEENLKLANARILIAKAAGADVIEQERTAAKFRTQINQMRAAFRV